MENTIRKKLEELEWQENVTILHAVESGSRAWGFASPDSDYDVRFIYMRQKEFYLRLEKMRDVIELPIDDMLDINGWDLQKALRLLYTSNPTLFEWNNSPIVYKTSPIWDTVRRVIATHFIPSKALHHYLNTARSNYREYLKGETVRLKKYFYVIRPLLACKWILNRNTPPPMLFHDLAEAELEHEMQSCIDNLLEIKKNTPEVGEGKRIDELNEYIESNIETFTAIMDTLPEEPKRDWEQLNAIFLEALRINNE